MAHIQDKHVASRKAKVTEDGEIIIAGSGPGGAITTTSSAEETVLVDDTTTTDVIYVCAAPIGTATSAAAWKIYAYDKTAGYGIKLYADGDKNYDNIADDRASLSYS